MYTIKVKSICNDPKIPITLKDIFRDRLISRLREHKVKIKGVSFFQDRTDFWCLYGLRRSDGSKMKFENWGAVNDVINNILDELEVNAFVQTEKYTLRKGMEHVTFESGE